MSLSLLVFVAFQPARVCTADDAPRKEAPHTEQAGDEADQDSTIKLGGVFEAVQQKSLCSGIEELSPLKIKKIAEHATEVSGGEAVVWFETKDLDNLIEEKKAEVELAELQLKQSELEHKQFLEALELDRDAANRKLAAAQQSHDNYQQHDRQRTLDSADFSLDNSKFSLQSANEELEQLRQMYEEDELTEVSEEFILKRAQRAVDRAKFSLEGAEVTHQRTRSQTVPKKDASEAEQLARAELAHQTEVKSLLHQRRKRELELREKRRSFEQLSAKLEKMKQERKQLVIKSPSDGVFFHGEIVRGRLPSKLVLHKPGVNVPNARFVIATIAEPSRLQVRLDVPEKHFHSVRDAKKLEVVAAMNPKNSLAATLHFIGQSPYTPGKFDAIVRLKKPATARVASGCEVVLEVETDGDKKQKEKKGNSKKDNGEVADDKS